MPIRMESRVHDKPHRRRSFAKHFRKRYVLGASFKHYHGWKIWMQQTRATQVPATVIHRHKYVSKPAVTPADIDISAAKNLASTLKGKIPQYLHESSLAKVIRLSHNIEKKQLKSIAMKLHWLRCRIAQKHFRHYWQPGPNNLGDYITKHHAVTHHREVCGTYLTPKQKLELLRRKQCQYVSTSRVW